MPEATSCRTADQTPVILPDATEMQNKVRLFILSNSLTQTCFLTGPCIDVQFHKLTCKFLFELHNGNILLKSVFTLTCHPRFIKFGNHSISRLRYRRDMCPLDDYDRDEEATTPLKNSFPQAPQIYLLSKRICSASNELQPSAVGQSQSQSPGVTQIVETSRPSLLEISPGSEWHENTLLPRQISQQPLRTSSSDRASQDTTEHKSEVTWPQDTSVQSPEQPAQSPRHHETPRPQRKSLSSYDPFLTCKIHFCFLTFTHC